MDFVGFPKSNSWIFMWDNCKYWRLDLAKLYLVREESKFSCRVNQSRNLMLTSGVAPCRNLTSTALLITL